MICQAAGVYRIDADAGFYSLYPTFAMTDFQNRGDVRTVFYSRFPWSRNYELHRSHVVFPVCRYV